MEPNTVIRTLQHLVHRYRYAALILVIGLGLLALPGRRPPPPDPGPPQAQQAELEEKLARILSRIEGAGPVEVLLTERIGPETVFQTDTRTDSAADTQSGQSDTVLVEGEGRSETGLVRRRDPPRYLGALVVCPGAEEPRVRLRIVQAVRCVTGLGSDQIQVVKGR